MQVMAGQMDTLIKHSATMANRIESLTAEVASLKQAAAAKGSASQEMQLDEQEEHEQQPVGT